MVLDSVSRISQNVVEAEIFLRTFRFYSNGVPVQFRKVPLLIYVCFAMTIIKAKGQILTHCRIDLEGHIFSHEQLFVAFSRVGRPDHLYVYAPQNKTLNVVK